MADDSSATCAAKDDLIDFGSPAPARGLKALRRVTAGRVTLANGTFEPLDGTRGTSHVTVAIHCSEAFTMERRIPGSDRLQSSIVGPGRAHVIGARLPFWHRWETSPSFFAFALDEELVRRTWREAFGGTGDPLIETSLDLKDPVIERLCGLGDWELLGGGGNGPVYAEGLATALAVHLLRGYAQSARPLLRHKGGLTPRQLRRVFDYIDAHLHDELDLSTLAETTGLSAHHFGQAFKATTGLSPHRYVIEKRIERARALLQEGGKSIAEVAYAVGFSSQSHLTLNFRRVTGITPARFRRSLE